MPKLVKGKRVPVWMPGRQDPPGVWNNGRYLQLMHSRDFPPAMYKSWAGMRMRRHAPSNDNHVLEFESARGTARLRWNPIRFAKTPECWVERII